ncbi:MAG: hypothetical protein AAF772_04600 [Acidobacteriota bacterium]
MKTAESCELSACLRWIQQITVGRKAALARCVYNVDHVHDLSRVIDEIEDPMRQDDLGMEWSFELRVHNRERAWMRFELLNAGLHRAQPAGGALRA